MTDAAWSVLQVRGQGSEVESRPVAQEKTRRHRAGGAKGDKRNSNCWNVFCQHISLVSLHVFFCDKERVFCIFVIVCTFLFVTHTVYCPVNKGVSFTETQTKLALQNAGSCRCNTCIRRRKRSKSSQVPPRTQTDGYNCCKLEKENPIFLL